ncbi:MAG: SPOR domain-containing protein [Bacteroidota bacterium]
MNRSILAELIRSNKRLIIPNVGAFLHRETESNTQLGITFSPFLKYNDGQLEELLVKGYGLSKIDALEQVKNLSSEIFNEIKEKGVYAIPGIGSLVIDAKGAIYLTSTEQPYTPNEPVVQNEKDSESQHLITKSTEVDFELKDNKPNKEPSINLHEEIKQDNSPNKEHYTEISPGVERVNTNALNSIVIDKSPAIDSEKEDKHSDKEEIEMRGENPKNSSKPSLVKITVFVAVSLVVILTFAFIVRELAFAPDETSWDNKGKPEKVEPIKLPSDVSSENDEIDKKYETTNPDEGKADTEPTNQQQTETAEEVIEKNLTQTRPANPTSPIFSLVLGSFAEKANAQKFVNELNAKGYSAEVYSKPNGKYLAVVGRYGSKEEANSQKEKLKKEFQGIWIISR